jgi:UDP:flavonoid glycosyltransferase YjiC (YdhE family)
LVLAPDQPFFWADVAAQLELGCTAVRFQIDIPPSLSPRGAPANIPVGRVQEYLAAAMALCWHEAAVKAGISGSGASLAQLSRKRPDIPTIALWPDWLLERRKDPNVRSFGFLIPDAGVQHCSAPDLPRMQGHAVFKRGLTDYWPSRFYSTAIAACRRLGLPGLLLGGAAPRGDLPPGIVWRRFVPLDLALKDARVIVHNGGIGTVAGAIKSGVPQIIVPRWIAQPRTAEWIRRLGAAAVLPPERFTLEALCRHIHRLVSGDRPSKRWRELSSRIDSDADLERIAEFLEMFTNRERSAPELERESG